MPLFRTQTALRCGFTWIIEYLTLSIFLAMYVYYSRFCITFDTVNKSLAYSGSLVHALECSLLWLSRHIPEWLRLKNYLSETAQILIWCTLYFLHYNLNRLLNIVDIYSPSNQYFPNIIMFITSTLPTLSNYTNLLLLDSNLTLNLTPSNNLWAIHYYTNSHLSLSSNKPPSTHTSVPYFSVHPTRSNGV